MRTVGALRQVNSHHAGTACLGFALAGSSVAGVPRLGTTHSGWRMPGRSMSPAHPAVTTPPRSSKPLIASSDTGGQGIVLLGPGRYRINDTLYIWPGIRVIGYGATRPVIVLPANTPGFQDPTREKVMFFFAGGPPRLRARPPAQPGGSAGRPFPTPAPAPSIPRSPTSTSRSRTETRGRGRARPLCPALFSRPHGLSPRPGAGRHP